MARFLGMSEKEMRALRVEKQVLPSYKMVDTCSAEFEAISPYYYSTYGEENEANAGNEQNGRRAGQRPHPHRPGHRV